MMKCVMLWAANHRGYGVYVSPEWYALTGQTQAEALGFGWTTLVHPEDRQTITEGFAEACQRQVEFVLRYRLRRMMGGFVWVLSAAQPSFTPLTRDFLGYFGVLSLYDDCVTGLDAKADIGSLKPGRTSDEFGPLSKLDIAMEYLIAAKAITIECKAAVGLAIDQALAATNDAIRENSLLSIAQEKIN